MKISLLHPSRGRSLRAFKAFQNWILTASGNYSIEHIISLDADDIELDNYRTFFKQSTFVVNNNTCLVDAANAGAKECTGNAIVLMSDDFDAFDKWDEKIAEHYINTPSGWLLKTSDGYEGWIVTLPIMDREYYQLQGYMYHPDTRHLFADTIMTHKAELEGRMIYDNSLVFRHRHPMYDKTVATDAIYNRSNKTWAQGEEVYLRLCREKFGLGPETDIYKLSPAAEKHINWLKNKLGDV